MSKSNRAPTIEDLRKVLAAARTKEERINDTFQDALLALRADRLTLDSLYDERKADAVRAIVEERSREDFDARIADAEKAVEKSEQTVDAARTALQQQRRVVEEAEGQITLRRHEILARALDGSVDDLHEKARALSVAAKKVRRIAVEHGFENGVPADLMFGPSDPLEPLANYQQKELLAYLFHLALLLVVEGGS